MSHLDETRRRFMAHFATIGLSSTLLPGVLWAEMQQSGAQTINADMLKTALSLSGLEFSEADRATMVANANQSLTRWETQRKLKIPDDISPPFHFSTIVPGIDVNRAKQPFRMSDAPPRPSFSPTAWASGAASIPPPQITQRVAMLSPSDSTT